MLQCMDYALIVPEDLEAEIKRKAEHLKEDPTTILRLAIRAGLPSVGGPAHRMHDQQTSKVSGLDRPYDEHLYDDYPQEAIDLQNEFAGLPQPEPEAQ